VPDAAPHQERSPTAVQASVPVGSQSPGWLRADQESRVRFATSHLDPSAKGPCRCGEQTAKAGPVVCEPPQPTIVFSRRSDGSSAARASPPSANGGLTGAQPKTVQENEQPPSTTDRGSIRPQALLQGRGSDPSPEGEGAAHEIQSDYIRDGIVPLHCPATAATRELLRHSPLGNRKLTRCPMPLCAGQQAPCGRPCDSCVHHNAAAPDGATVSMTRPTRARNAPQGAQAESRHESAAPRHDDSVGDRGHSVSKCAAATAGHITRNADGPPSKSSRPGRTNTSENMGSTHATLQRSRSPSEQPQPSGTHGQGSPICSSSSFAMASHAESLLFSELPPAVLCMILRFLPTTSVTAFGATCRYAHALTQLPASWSYLEDSTVGNIFRLEKEAPNGRKNHSKIKGLKMLTERFTGVTKLAIDLTSVISSSRRSCHQGHHETSAAALLSPALLRLHTTRLASEDTSGTVIARQRNDGGRPRPAVRRPAGEGAEVGDEIADPLEGVRAEADAFILLHGLLGERRLQFDCEEGQSVRPNHAPSPVDEPPTQFQGRRRRSAELELPANQNAAVEASLPEAEQRLQEQHPRTSGPSHVPERSVTGDLTLERRRGAEREGATQDETDARGNSGEHLSNLRRPLRGLHDEVSHTSLQVVTSQPSVPGAAHHGVASRIGEFGSVWIRREVRSSQRVMDGQSAYPEARQPANVQRNSGSHCPDQLLPAGQNEATLANPEQTTRLSFTPPQSEGLSECQPATLETQPGRRMSPSREQATFQGPRQQEHGPLSGRGIHESPRLPGSHISAVPLLVLVPAAFSENTPSDGPEQRARANQVLESGGERRREQGEDRDRELITVPGRGVTGSRNSESDHHPAPDRIRTERQQLLLLHQLLMHLQQQRREQQRDERPQRPPSTLWGLPSRSDNAVHLQSLRVPPAAGMHSGDAPDTTSGRQTVPTQQCHEAAEGRETRALQWQQEEGHNDGSRRSTVLGPPSRDSAPGTQWQLSPDGMIQGYESHTRQNVGGLTGQSWPLVVERTSESAQGAIAQGRADDLTTTRHQRLGGSARLAEQTQSMRLRRGSPLPSSSDAGEREVSFFGQPTLVAGDGGSVPSASEPVEESIRPLQAALIQQSQRDVPLSRDRERSVTPATTVLGQELFGEGVRQQRGGSQRRQLLLLPFLFASQFPLAFARQGEELTVMVADREDAVHSGDARPRDRSLSQRQQQSSQLFARRGSAFSRLLLGPRPTASTPTSAGANAVKPALLRALFSGLRQLMQLTLKLEAREALQLPQLSLQLGLVKGLLQQNAQTLRVIKVSVELPVDADLTGVVSASARPQRSACRSTKRSGDPSLQPLKLPRELPALQVLHVNFPVYVPPGFSASPWFTHLCVRCLHRFFSPYFKKSEESQYPCDSSPSNNYAPFSSQPESRPAPRRSSRWPRPRRERSTTSSGGRHTSQGRLPRGGRRDGFHLKREKPPAAREETGMPRLRSCKRPREEVHETHQQKGQEGDTQRGEDEGEQENWGAVVDWGLSPSHTLSPSSDVGAASLQNSPARKAREEISTHFKKLFAAEASSPRDRLTGKERQCEQKTDVLCRTPLSADLCTTSKQTAEFRCSPCYSPQDGDCLGPDSRSDDRNTGESAARLFSRDCTTRRGTTEDSTTLSEEEMARTRNNNNGRKRVPLSGAARPSPFSFSHNSAWEPILHLQRLLHVGRETLQQVDLQGDPPRTFCCLHPRLKFNNLRRLSLGWTCTAELLLLHSLLLKGHLPQLRKLQFSGPSGGAGLSMMHLQLYALLNSPPPNCPHNPPLPLPPSDGTLVRSPSDSVHAEGKREEGTGVTRPCEKTFTLNKRKTDPACTHARECESEWQEKQPRREGSSVDPPVTAEDARSSPRKAANRLDAVAPLRKSTPETGEKDKGDDDMLVPCPRCASMRDGTAHGVYFKYAALDIDFEALLNFRLALRRHGLFAFYRDERNKLNLLHVEDEWRRRFFYHHVRSPPFSFSSLSFTSLASPGLPPPPPSAALWTAAPFPRARHLAPTSSSDGQRSNTPSPNSVCSQLPRTICCRGGNQLGQASPISPRRSEAGVPTGPDPANARQGPGHSRAQGDTRVRDSQTRTDSGLLFPSRATHGSPADELVAVTSVHGPHTSTSITQDLPPPQTRSVSQGEAPQALDPFRCLQGLARGARLAPENSPTAGRAQTDGLAAPVSNSRATIASETSDRELEIPSEGPQVVLRRAENERRGDPRAGGAGTEERAALPPVLPGTPAGGAPANVDSASAGQESGLQSSGRSRVLSCNALGGEGGSENATCLYPSVGVSMTGRDLFLLEMWLAPELCRDLQAPSTLHQLRRQLLNLWADKLTAEQRAVYDEIIVRRYIEERQGVEEWQFRSVRPWWDRH
ncbi:hypothetical protein CSUI_003239, partial [Cystoisospora suis]